MKAATDSPGAEVRIGEGRGAVSEFDDAEGGFDDAESEQLRRPSAYSPARHVREWIAGERNSGFLVVRGSFGLKACRKLA